MVRRGGGGGDGGGEGGVLAFEGCPPALFTDYFFCKTRESSRALLHGLEGRAAFLSRPRLVHRHHRLDLRRAPPPAPPLAESRHPPPPAAPRNRFALPPPSPPASPTQ